MRVDSDFATEIVTRGEATMPFSPGDWCKVPENFKRKSIQLDLSSDGTKIIYEIVDKEQATNKQ